MHSVFQQIFFLRLKIINLKKQYPYGAYVMVWLEPVKVLTRKGLMWAVITDPCPDFNGGLIKPPLK